MPCCRLRRHLRGAPCFSPLTKEAFAGVTVVRHLPQPIFLPAFLCHSSAPSAPAECLGFEVPDFTEWLCPRHFCMSCGSNRPRYTCRFCPMSYCQEHAPADCPAQGAAGADMPGVAEIVCPRCTKMRAQVCARGAAAATTPPPPRPSPLSSCLPPSFPPRWLFDS